MIKPRSLTRVFQEQSKFLYNQEKPDAWHAQILRATGPVGSSFTIEFPEWNDQAFLLRARDLGKHRAIRIFRDNLPMFADSVIEFPGQPIGLLIVPNRDELMRLEHQVKVSYTPNPETLPASVLHSERRVTMGDIDTALSISSRHVESEFDLGTMYKIHYEPRGAIAEWKSDMLYVQCSTSWPQLVRRLVSESTGLAQKNITVISQPSSWLPDRFLVDSSLLACYVSMAALTCMQPVQLFLSNSEDLHFSTRQPKIKSRIVSGHRADGQLIAVKAELEIDMGAWPLGSQEVIQYSLLGLCSTYRCPNQDLKVRVMRSPHAPRFLQSTFGFSTSQQAMEQHVSIVCRELDADELDWRNHNLLGKGDRAPYGAQIEQAAVAHQVLLEVVRKSDFRRTHAGNELLRKHRSKVSGEFHTLSSQRNLSGIGVSLSNQGNGLLISTELLSRPRIRLSLGTDGHLEVISPMPTTNLSLKEAWTHALEELTGIEERDISFSRFSTDEIEDSGPARFSRIVGLYSPLLAAAAKSLRQKMQKSSPPLEIKASLQNLRHLKWDEDSFSGTPFFTRSWAAAVVSLSLDPVTLRPVVHRVWICINGGAILHPAKAENMVRQIVVDHINWMAESLNEGIHQNGYPFAHTIDAPSPEISVDFLNQERYTDSEQLLVHAGGIGEVAKAAIPAAFANALAQALGRMPPRLPTDSALICRILGLDASEIEHGETGQNQGTVEDET